MKRLASVLVIGSMAVIAVSTVVVLNVLFDFPMGQAAILGMLGLGVMMLVQSLAQRRGERAWLEGRIADIAAVASDVNSEVALVSDRLARLERDLASRPWRDTEPLAEEVEVLGGLLKQVTDALADAEQRLELLEKRPLAPLQMPAPMPAPAPVMTSPEPVQTGFPPQPFPQQTFPPPMPMAEEPRLSPARAAIEPIAPPEPFEPVPREAPRPAPAQISPALEQEIVEAIRSERLEVHLQPIVTLPQRKVRIYEAMAMMRTRGGETVTGPALRRLATGARLAPRVDTFMVVRAFQILKRLNTRNREVGILIGLSLASLADNAFFREFQGFVTQNRALAELVTFGFPAADLALMGPIEQESLDAIAELGYRFAIGDITDFRQDFQTLGARGFRFAKVPVEVLLGRAVAQDYRGDIHAVDLSGHLARKGLELVVDQVDTESQVLDLLDYDIRLAQGNLFSAPRLVRPEVLQTPPAAEAQPPAPRGPLRAAR
ncbi:EAL domain-containing protein [Methylobrevis pamukkalensis]|nr:EAL domain-containing protein [Methylobrevis pamukkalensis]